MSQVSNRKLGKQIEEEVYNTFWSNIAKLTKKDDVELFFSDLFTKTERVNFTKRLAIAILLFKGYDWVNTREILKVSFGTIAKVAAKKNASGYKLFFEKLEKEQQWKKFWNNLAKTYLITTHPEKFMRLGNEAVENIYLRKRKTRLY